MGWHNIRMTDPSNHLPSDLRFYLWPYFLKLSPSYAEVHRLYTTNPRAPRRPRIPASLKAVAEVYEIVGNVCSECVHDWSKERWVEIFGLHLASEQLKMLCVLRKGRAVSLDSLAPRLNNYLDSTRPQMNNPKTMILAIPMDQKIEPMISTIREAIKFYRDHDGIDHDDEPATPQLTLEEGGPRLANLIEMYNTVLYKAKHPDHTAWQVAYDLRLSPAHNHAIDDNSNPDISPEDAKKALGNITQRNLKTAFDIAENAARGKFPLTTAVESMTIDMRPYEAIAALQADPLPLQVRRNSNEQSQNEPPNTNADDMFADRRFIDDIVF